ncbi:MAG: MotA/TolQ/ExbB proton channel family protein [Myxococcales bacterium]|nr:MotA/TolQ/ExbB proton channel family protein [Myxococcales bacterium]
MSVVWQDLAIARMMWAGGWMMFPLALLGVWVSYLLILRSLELGWVWSWLRGASSKRPNQQRDSEEIMEVEQTRVRMLLMRVPVLTQTLISSAPLMGLLGTVSGMITTFSALADGALYQPTGGIAGGISQALLTTQLGLGIALPALLWERVLLRWSSRLLGRLERSSSHFSPREA